MRPQKTEKTVTNPQLKRCTLTIKNLDPQVKKELKAHCALQGITIEKQILELIQSYLREKPKKKH